MELSGVRLGRRSEAELEQMLATAATCEPTYDHVGSSLVPGRTPGVPDRTAALEVDGTLADAVAALRRWDEHRGLRARVMPPTAAIEVGVTLVVVLPLGPLELAVPNRIVAVVDEPTRFGFAYGSLPGHAEAGEEAYLAEHVAPGRVRLQVRVQARPASRVLRRVGMPGLALLQRITTRRYVRAWATAIDHAV